MLALGFKIPTSGTSSLFRGFIPTFKAKKKYEDLLTLIQIIMTHRIPITFDREVLEICLRLCRVPAENRRGLLLLSNFPGTPKRAMGALTTAIVLEGAKTVALSFHFETENQNVIFQEPMTDAEFAAYRSHPETYFGVHREVGNGLKTPLEMFEWLHKNYSQTPRARLLEFLKSAPDFETLSKLPDDELLLLYCERMTGGVMMREAQTPLPAA